MAFRSLQVRLAALMASDEAWADCKISQVYAPVAPRAGDGCWHPRRYPRLAAVSVNPLEMLGPREVQVVLQTGLTEFGGDCRETGFQDLERLVAQNQFVAEFWILRRLVVFHLDVGSWLG